MKRNFVLIFIWLALHASAQSDTTDCFWTKCHFYYDQVKGNVRTIETKGYSVRNRKKGRGGEVKWIYNDYYERTGKRS